MQIELNKKQAESLKTAIEIEVKRPVSFINFRYIVELCECWRELDNAMKKEKDGEWK